LHEWIARRSQTKTSTRTRFNAGSLDSHYQRDRARVIHSAWFRALQSKTQVLGLGESDFYRTRLTHSLEVAQIGSGICESLRGGDSSDEQREWLAPLGLMDAICLAHDIGHSPFGHGGEVALNYMMRDHGCFEANGQTLRILARLGEYSENDGLDLTRRTTLGIIKYPGFCTDLANYAPADDDESELNIDRWHPPKGLFTDEREVLEWTLEPFTGSDRDYFKTADDKPNSHRKTRYKSFDTSIMELADDIAYGVHDLEDAVALKLISPEQWQRGFLEPLAEIDGNPVSKDRQFYSDSLFSDDHRRRKRAISRLVGWFINSVTLAEDETFEHPLLRLQGHLRPEAKATLTLLKRFVMDEVILRPELQALQYKGQQVILKIFQAYLHNQQRLLPSAVYRESQESGNPHRTICDYIAGLTDASATRIYHRLSTPSAGSIFDRI
jgi:dGTPase